MLHDCHTRLMAADIFTKFFTDRFKWLHAIQLIAVCMPKDVEALLASGVEQKREPSAGIHSTR